MKKKKAGQKTALRLARVGKMCQKIGFAQSAAQAKAILKWWNFECAQLAKSAVWFLLSRLLAKLLMKLEKHENRTGC